MRYQIFWIVVGLLHKNIEAFFMRQGGKNLLVKRGINLLAKGFSFAI